MDSHANGAPEQRATRVATIRWWAELPKVLSSMVQSIRHPDELAPILSNPSALHYPGPKTRKDALWTVEASQARVKVRGYKVVEFGIDRDLTVRINGKTRKAGEFQIFVARGGKGTSLHDGAIVARKPEDSGVVRAKFHVWNGRVRGFDDDPERVILKQNPRFHTTKTTKRTPQTAVQPGGSEISGTETPEASEAEVPVDGSDDEDVDMLNTLNTLDTLDTPATPSKRSHAWEPPAIKKVKSEPTPTSSDWPKPTSPSQKNPDLVPPQAAAGEDSSAIRRASQATTIAPDMIQTHRNLESRSEDPNQGGHLVHEISSDDENDIDGNRIPASCVGVKPDEDEDTKPLPSSINETLVIFLNAQDMPVRQKAFGRIASCRMLFDNAVAGELLDSSDDTRCLQVTINNKRAERLMRDSDKDFERVGKKLRRLWAKGYRGCVEVRRL